MEEQRSEDDAQLAFAESDIGRAREGIGQVVGRSDLGTNLVLILGAPRSGTTWLAKIFDSHPSVIYRHEPDTVLRNLDVPIMCDIEETDAYRDLVCDYLARLTEIRTLKAAGSLPIFTKDYRGRLRQLRHTAFIYGLHAVNMLSRGSRMVRDLSIPDSFDPSRHPPLRTVVKSVSFLGRIGLIAEVLPQSRIIFLLRHPCGQIASMLRGTRLGKLRERLSVEEMAACEYSARLGLTREALETMPVSEQLAWRWALFNQKALDDLRGRYNVRILRYEELCAQPMNEAEALFAFAGLSWPKQSAAFIRTSTKGAAIERYYGVVRDSKSAANAWRSHFSAADREGILAITRQFEVGRLYPD